jgi:2-oxoglutarate ferredoxin oxidoreductase subunit gamma
LEKDKGRTVSRSERFEIRIAGFGGQGVVTIGRILGEAFSIHEGKNSANSQSYGPESRGGACKSEVVVADGDIYYPNVRRPDVLVALSQRALDTYLPDLKEDGILLIDPTAVKEIPHPEKYRIHQVAAMELAHEIGSVKYQNSVALGALYPLIEDELKESSLRKAIVDNVPAKTIDINMKAFEKGLSAVQKGFA